MKFLWGQNFFHYNKTNIWNRDLKLKKIALGEIMESGLEREMRLLREERAAFEREKNQSPSSTTTTMTKTTTKGKSVESELDREMRLLREERERFDKERQLFELERQRHKSKRKRRGGKYTSRLNYCVCPHRRLIFSYKK